jgi:hypothetical protein
VDFSGFPLAEKYPMHPGTLNNLQHIAASSTHWLSLAAFHVPQDLEAQPLSNRKRLRVRWALKVPMSFAAIVTVVVGLDWWPWQQKPCS